MDRRRAKSLEGKCGSCRFFTIETGKECTGFCSGRMKQKGRLERTYKCIGYEAAPTIITADGKDIKVPNREEGE
jgi:hypothetical protein